MNYLITIVTLFYFNIGHIVYKYLFVFFNIGHFTKIGSSFFNIDHTVYKNRLAYFNIDHIVYINLHAFFSISGPLFSKIGSSFSISITVFTKICSPFFNIGHCLQISVPLFQYRPHCLHKSVRLFFQYQAGCLQKFGSPFSISAILFTKICTLFFNIGHILSKNLLDSFNIGHTAKTCSSFSISSTLSIKICSPLNLFNPMEFIFLMRSGVL